MGAKQTKSKYTHSNLVLEYHFNLNKPTSKAKVVEKIGASLYEFHPDEQDTVIDELKYVIQNGDEKVANLYYKYKNLQICGVTFMMLVIFGSLSYIILAFYEILSFISFFWTIIAGIAVFVSIFTSIYGLYFTNKARDKSLQRWRKSIITKISTKTLEWQTNSNEFTFCVIYNADDIDQAILRITYGLPKFVRSESIYFQASPKRKVVSRQHSRKFHSMHMISAIKSPQKCSALQMSKIKKPNSGHQKSSKSSFDVIGMNGMNHKNHGHGASKSCAANLLKDWKINHDENKDKFAKRHIASKSYFGPGLNDKKSRHSASGSMIIKDVKNVFSEPSSLKKRKSLHSKRDSTSRSNVTLLSKINELNLDISQVSASDSNEDDDDDDDGNNNHKHSSYRMLKSSKSKSKSNYIDYNNQETILPIMIRGINGPQILLQGIKRIINGKEVIIIDNMQHNIYNDSDRSLVQYIQNDVDKKEESLPYDIDNKSQCPMPISPIDPDLTYNNDVVLPLTYTDSEFAQNVVSSYKE